ncbi:glycosyltransferase family 1 protein [Legionella sp. km772]|uniref:glycosyltransferase family 4 protein n=1 Tax=Legionella sp. km772 TaxID=2498111 RepID=UPI000F8E1189|nr:glycosyltransferase family 1 protein [Legionella sp. km772]RUR07059.1 glycosyltransferase family 1 protein [Legionella sp. km772]
MTTIRLLIDSTFIITELKRKRPPHGIPRVILAYLRHYGENLQLVYRLRGKLFILSQHYSKQIIALILLWNPKHYPAIFALLLRAIYMAEKINKDNQYFLFKLDQNGMKYPNYFNQLKRLGIKTIIMIHDLFPITHPEYSDPSYAKQFETNIRLSLKYASGLLCVSKNTQNILAQYVRLNNLHSPLTIPTHLAPGFEAIVAAKTAPLAHPYFVIISTLVARKNHLLLLYIWRKLVDDLGAQAPKLVIIGKRSSECSTTLALLDRCNQLKQYVIELTATDEELQNYLNHARALLFPTFAEGYGLPLIEALSTKVPVLCSNLAIFKEIAQDIPDYIDPIDGKAWMDMILDYAQENSLHRKAQMQRLSQFKIPTWEEHFDRVNQFIAGI